MAGRRDHVAANSQPDCGRRAQVLANPSHSVQVASEARLSCDHLPQLDKFRLLPDFGTCRAHIIASTRGNAHEWTVLYPQPAAHGHTEPPKSMKLLGSCCADTPDLTARGSAQKVSVARKPDREDSRERTTTRVLKHFVIPRWRKRFLPNGEAVGITNSRPSHNINFLLYTFSTKCPHGHQVQLARMLLKSQAIRQSAVSKTARRKPNPGPPCPTSLHVGPAPPEMTIQVVLTGAQLHHQPQVS